MICFREVLNSPPSRTSTPARSPVRHTSGPRADDRHPRASAAYQRARAVTRIRPAAWVVAAVALFLLAVAGYALLVHASPQYYWTQIDTAVYRDGGIAVRNQQAILYALEFGAAKLPFTYTPFAALLFAVGSGASFATWQVGLAVLTIGLLPVVAYLSLGLAGRPAGLARAAAAFAIAAGGLWLGTVGAQLFFGPEKP